MLIGTNNEEVRTVGEFGEEPFWNDIKPKIPYEKITIDSRQPLPLQHHHHKSISGSSS